MLVEAKKVGYRASVLFIVQRTDAQVITLNDKTDPEFGKSLRNVFLEGVDVFAYHSEFSETNITLKGKVKTDLNSRIQLRLPNLNWI
jgi:sugar fermentation stimulation protein A